MIWNVFTRSWFDGKSQSLTLIYSATYSVVYKVSGTLLEARTPKQAFIFVKKYFELFIFIIDLKATTVF